MIVKNSCSKITVLMEPNKCKFYITISSVNVKNYFYIIIKSTYPPMSNTRVLIGSILTSLSYPSPSIKLSSSTFPNIHPVNCRGFVVGHGPHCIVHKNLTKATEMIAKMLVLHIFPGQGI